MQAMVVETKEAKKLKVLIFFGSFIRIKFIVGEIHLSMRWNSPIHETVKSSIGDRVIAMKFAHHFNENYIFQ